MRQTATVERSKKDSNLQDLGQLLAIFPSLKYNLEYFYAVSDILSVHFKNLSTTIGYIWHYIELNIVTYWRKAKGVVPWPPENQNRANEALGTKG